MIALDPTHQPAWGQLAAILRRAGEKDALEALRGSHRARFGKELR